MTHPEYTKQVRREEVVRAIAGGLLIFSVACMLFIALALG